MSGDLYSIQRELSYYRNCIPQLEAQLSDSRAECERLRGLLREACDELHGYADAGCSNKAEHLCAEIIQAIERKP